MSALQFRGAHEVVRGHGPDETHFDPPLPVVCQVLDHPLHVVFLVGVHQEGDVVRLEDGASQTVVSVMPSRGNSAFDMRVKGKKVLYSPFATAQEYQAGRGMSGIPFLAPWANRLDESAFYANGKKYTLSLSKRFPFAIRLKIDNQVEWELAEIKAPAK